VSQSTLISRLMDQCVGIGHPYPWNGLEAALERDPQGRFSLIGYGSLLNEHSARRTVKDTPVGGHTPVVAFGVQRAFEYPMPAEAISHDGHDDVVGRYAALNAIWTGESEHAINARLLSIGIEDLDDLRERERGYHLKLVAVVPWKGQAMEPSRAFVLCASSEPVDGNVYVDSTLEPYPPYLEVCREGCREVDADFEEMFLSSTLLGDRKTTLRDFLGRNGDGKTPSV